MGFDRNIGKGKHRPASPALPLVVPAFKSPDGLWEDVSPASADYPAPPEPTTPSPIVVRLRLSEGGWQTASPVIRERKTIYKRRWGTIQRNRKGHRADPYRRTTSPLRKRYVVRPNHQRPWIKPIAKSFNTPSPATTATTSSVTMEYTMSPRELSHVLRGETLSPEARRLMIAGYFLEAMEAPAEEDDADTITHIQKEFSMPIGSRDVIARVIDGVRRADREMVPYTGVRKQSSRVMLRAVPLDSIGAAIIAESMEDGSGIRRAHSDAMDWLRRRHESGEADVPHWGLSATYQCYLRMQPTVTVVMKRAQGSTDPSSAWCQACHGWVTQLLIRTRQEIPAEWGGPPTAEELELPWFREENLTFFDPHQVVDWDETHQELVMLGGSGRSQRGKEVQVRFHRTADGRVDPTGGAREGSTIADRRYQLSVKYNTDVCFMLGTASVLLADGTEEGRRGKAFDYTGRVVLTHKDFVLRQQTEIARVRSLTGDGLPWVTGRRNKEDGIFDQDAVTVLHGIGDEKARVLRIDGVTKVEHVACLLDEDIASLAERDGLTVNLLKKARDEATTAAPGKFNNVVVDHKKAANPYESLYGENWKQEINETTYMKNFVDVRDLAMRMAVETDRLMEGTVHEDRGIFKHDALILLTADETKEWMRETYVNGRSIFSRWLLPEAGLNDRIVVDGKVNKHYGGRPPGNLPRLMSLDEFGNKNLMDCVNRHVSATARMERGPDPATDPKYEFCDTVRASRALLRCWDPAHGTSGGAPSSKTIVEGHRRVWGKHLGDIRAAKGCMVGARVGHRSSVEPTERGGVRERGPAPWTGEGQWLNDDARPAQ